MLTSGCAKALQKRRVAIAPLVVLQLGRGKIIKQFASSGWKVMEESDFLNIQFGQRLVVDDIGDAGTGSEMLLRVLQPKSAAAGDLLELGKCAFDVKTMLGLIRTRIVNQRAGEH
jgi:hypothetical protein